MRGVSKKLSREIQDAENERRRFVDELISKQERLGPEFEKAFFDNLHELYAR